MTDRMAELDALCAAEREVVAERKAKRERVDQPTKELSVTEAEATIAEVCALYDLTPEAFRGRTKERTIVDARTVFALVMRQRGYVTTQIAYAMWRDRFSVSYYFASASAVCRYVADGIVEGHLKRSDAARPSRMRKTAVVAGAGRTA